MAQRRVALPQLGGVGRVAGGELEVKDDQVVARGEPRKLFEETDLIIQVGDGSAKHRVQPARAFVLDRVQDLKARQVMKVGVQRERGDAPRISVASAER